MRRFVEWAGILGLIMATTAVAGAEPRRRREPPPATPNAAPPAPRAERVRQRRGYIRTQGTYQWRNGRWVWVAGRYEREQQNKVWVDARWEQQNGVWVFVEGGWRDPIPLYPTQPPPPAQAENAPPRPGDTWVPGRVDVPNGSYGWLAGS